MSQQQSNPTFSYDADNYHANVTGLLEQLGTLREKYAAGELHEADLVAWKNPMITICTLEAVCRWVNLIGDLQSELKELQQQNRNLQDNVAWLNGAVFDSLDDFDEQSSSDLDEESATPSDHGLPTRSLVL